MFIQIQIWNLNPRPSEHVSTLITTKPGFLHSVIELFYYTVAKIIF